MAIEGRLLSDGNDLDTERAVQNWCFCGRDEAELDRDELGKIKGMLKNGERKKKDFERDYLNVAETKEPGINWRLTATAIGAWQRPSCAYLAIPPLSRRSRVYASHRQGRTASTIRLLSSTA